MNRENEAIEYENTMRDLIAFTKYHYKKPVRNMNIFFVFIFFMAAIVSIMRNSELFLEDPFINAFVNLTMGAILIIFLIFIARFGIPLQVWILYKSGANKGTIGRHRIILTSESLTEETDYNKTIVDWVAIENIVKTKTHLLIYQSAVAAYVIPLKAFGNDANWQGFMEKAKHYQALASSAN